MANSALWVNHGVFIDKSVQSHNGVYNCTGPNPSLSLFLEALKIIFKNALKQVSDIALCLQVIKLFLGEEQRDAQSRQGADCNL